MKRVILVDNEPTFRKGLKTILQNIGDVDVVAEASNGEEFLNVIEETAADLVFMDVRMPVMDGIEASKMIKGICPDIPIVIQTASVMGSAFEEISKSNCDDTIFKPIDAVKLIEIIANQFDKYSKK